MNTNPLLASHDQLDFAAIKPEHMTPALETLLTDARRVLNQVTSPDTPLTWESVVAPLDEALNRLERAWGTGSHLQSVMDSPAWREAINRHLPEISTFFIEVSQHQGLYQKTLALRESAAYRELNPTQQRIVDRTLRDFRLSGAHLPEKERQQLQAIGEKLSLLGQQFSEHLLDATDAWTLHLEDDARLSGIPATERGLFEAAAQARGLTGYVITLQMPSYLAVMTYADDRDLRQTVHEAYNTRASDLGKPEFDNTPLIDEILALRHEAATLLGFENFAQESLATKMAPSPEAVLTFLHDLARRAKPYALKDKEQLEAFAHKLGFERLEAWDTAYVSEKLRQDQYLYKESEVREYFTEPAVFSGLFHVAQALYGITIEATPASVWHEDVTYFTVYKDGTPIAGFYADLYAREGKRGGAWMNDDRTRAVFDGKLDLPTAFLTCNFAKPKTGEVATLMLDDVITLFHEFGHTLHHLLTTQDERSVSGIHGVEWDAVELPSQFMENFVWDRRVMKALTQHVKTGESIPDALYDKLVAAKNFQAGLGTMRQLEFGLFDMTIHMMDKPHVMTVLSEVKKETQMLPSAPYARFPQSFSHIFAGGYAAGYYSYKWAEVLSADAFAAFEETDILSRETGLRFWQAILSMGSSRDAMDNFVAFRGREPSIDALLRHNGMA